MRKRKYQILTISIALIAAILWWPQAIDGRILHGETSKPIEDVRVRARSSVLKPWWPLAALAWGEVTSNVTSTVRTDKEGRFRIWVAAGVRLHGVNLNLSKPGFVVRPIIGGGTATAGYFSSQDYATKMFGIPASRLQDETFHIWPATENVDVGSAYFDVKFNDEATAVFGESRHQLDFRLLRTGDTVIVQARLADGTIRLIEPHWNTLVAPIDGYLPEVRVETSCHSDTMFFTRSSDGRYGWLMLDFFSLCFRDDAVRLKYRLAEEANVRALVCPSEVENPTSTKTCQSRSESRR
ncbi:MAG: hypothetical protein AAF438_21810 [Pseudomonadota bacterium]